MKDNIKNFIKIVHEIKMTEEERESVRLHITSFAKLNLTEKTSRFKILSPYFSKFHFKVNAKIVGFVLLFFVLGISGMAYTSASALPGDLLYSIKIAKENVEEKFVSTPQERIALKQKRINTRFNEVETLIKEKKITPENRSIADTKIKEDAVDIGTDIEKINKDNPQAAIEAKMSLKASIQEHQEKIKDLIEKSIDTNLNIDDWKKDINNSDGHETISDEEEDTEIDSNNDATTPDIDTDSDKISSGTKDTISSDDPSKIDQNKSTKYDSSTIQNIKITPEGDTSATSTTSTTKNVN